jgi:SanA protein
MLLPRAITTWYAKSRTYSIESVEKSPIAIVFGAGLLRDGSPTPILKDRIETAATLYNSGRVKKLLMSGDNRFLEYNEPAAMRQYALELGVSEQDIVLDYAGRRTYDTCYRARDIFVVSEAILITQSFHLPRAVYTCNNIGIIATGVPSDGRQYRSRSMVFWQIRETLATIVALWQVHITNPLPVLGEPEPIFIDILEGTQNGGNV